MAVTIAVSVTPSERTDGRLTVNSVGAVQLNVDDGCAGGVRLPVSEGGGDALEMKDDVRIGHDERKEWRTFSVNLTGSPGR